MMSRWVRPCLALALWVPQFSSGVNLVEVYVSVTAPGARPVTGLTREDFQVFEDGERQTIGAFAAGEVPLAVAVAIDRSFSMAGRRLALAQAAALGFLGELRPADRSMIVAIGSEVETVAPLSATRDEQREALAGLKPWGTTGLYDAIIESIEAIQPAPGRRALVLLSDGDDRYSHASGTDALDRARRSDVMVYPIALGPSRPELFAELATLTGGRSFHARDPNVLTETLRAIARELRHQYLLGYTPVRPLVPGRSEWRSIRVSVNRAAVTVRSRDGYMVR